MTNIAKLHQDKIFLNECETVHDPEKGIYMIVKEDKIVFWARLSDKFDNWSTFIEGFFKWLYEDVK